MLARMLRQADRPIRYAARTHEQEIALRLMLRAVPQASDIPHRLLVEANRGGQLQDAFGPHYPHALRAIRELYDPHLRESLDEAPTPDHDLHNLMGLVDMYQDRGHPLHDFESNAPLESPMSVLHSLVTQAQGAGRSGGYDTTMHSPDELLRLMGHARVQRAMRHAAEGPGTGHTLHSALRTLADGLRRSAGNPAVGEPTDQLADRSAMSGTPGYLGDVYDHAMRVLLGVHGSRLGGVGMGGIANHVRGRAQGALRQGFDIAAQEARRG
jgi:hypothetical protein